MLYSRHFNSQAHIGPCLSLFFNTVSVPVSFDSFVFRYWYTSFTTVLSIEDLFGLGVCSVCHTLQCSIAISTEKHWITRRSSMHWSWASWTRGSGGCWLPKVRWCRCSRIYQDDPSIHCRWKPIIYPHYLLPSSSYYHRSWAIEGPWLVEGQGDQAEDVLLALNEDIVHIKKDCFGERKEGL